MTRPLAMAALLPGVASALSLTPLVYHLLRAVEHLRSPEPDPAGVVWAARSRLLDRVGVTAYVVVAIALFVTPWLARRPAALERATLACAALGALGAAVGPMVAR